jgi:MFS family permease
MATATAGRVLRRSEWRVLVILGVPTFALALGITTVSTFLPVLAEEFTKSSIAVGLLIGGEGLMALWLPLVVGSWSDRLHTPIGSRLPFIIAATPPLVVALALLGFVNSIAMAAVVVAVFFVGYFVAYEPYRALYPDLVDPEIAGRAQSTQAIFRGLGTFLALLGGGVLLRSAIRCRSSRRRSSSAVHDGVRRDRRALPAPRALARRGAEARPDRGRRRRPHALLRDRLRAFLVANALWELALAALKTFVVLCVTQTLGFSLAGSSGVIAAAALIVLAGAVVSGPLGDRYGRALVMRWSLALYGLGLLVPFATTATVPLIIAVPLIAFGGGVTMSLPYALLIPMMPAGAHGVVTGLCSLSRGLGISLGPLLGGVAIEAAGEDYRWVWLVCAAAILASIAAMRPLRDAD